MAVILEFLSYAALRCVLLPFQIATLGWARSLGAALGLVAYYIAPIRKSVVERNLRVYFGREWTGQQIKRGVREAYRNAGIAAGEFAFGQRLSPKNIERYLHVEQLENYHKAHSSGRPVIFYSAHLTMWELSQGVLHWFEEPFYVVMKRIHNRFLNEYANRRRSGFGAHMISQKGAVTVLGEKSGITSVNYGFLVDQRAAKGKGVWINIRGTAAAAMVGPAVLAVRFGGLPILPLQMLREKHGMTIRFHPPLEYSLTGDQAADIQRVTQLMNDQVTGWVLERPAEYFWFHNRFKVHPSEKDAAAEYQKKIDAGADAAASKTV